MSDPAHSRSDSNAPLYQRGSSSLPSPAISVDFGQNSDDYADHRAGFPLSFFDKLFTEGFVRPSDAVLDLGTGTGTIAVGLAALGCRVVGIDRSEEQLRAARRAAAKADLRVELQCRSAEETGLAGASFDLITAGQCWHWFDREAVVREVRRLLKPNGRLLIAHFDRIPLPGSVAQVSNELLSAYCPEWNPLGHGVGIYPEWLHDLAVGKFQSIWTTSFDQVVGYTYASWVGRMRTSYGALLLKERGALNSFEASLRLRLERQFPREPLSVPHRVWIATGIAADLE